MLSWQSRTVYTEYRNLTGSGKKADADRSAFCFACGRIYRFHNIQHNEKRTESADSVLKYQITD